jgi:parvulin-like peptidyl-prolyl isomerase
MSIRRICQKVLAPVIIILVIGLTVGMFYIGIPQLSKEPTSYQGKAIKINGKVIGGEEFNNYLMRAAQQASQMQQYGMTYNDAQIRDTALNIALQDTAFNQEISKAKITATETDVDKLIKKYLPTEEELQSFMEKQGYTDKNEFRKAVKNDIVKQKFITLKARQLKIKVPKEQIEGMLEQIQVSHILIGLKSGNTTRTDAEALARANEVYAKATASNADFSQLAKQYSDDPGSKDQGGVIGPMPLEQFKGSMVKEFVDGSLALKAGEVSRPVKTEYGYHIIKLDSKDVPSGKEYKEKYKEAENDLLLQSAPYNQSFQNWLQGVYKKAQANMEVMDPALKAYRFKQEQKWDEAAKAYEKAIKMAYYKNKIDLYIDASDVYLKLKQPKEAIKVLKRVPAQSQDIVDYQIALAKAYNDAGQKNAAKQTLTKFSAAHSTETNIHESLKAAFTEMKMTAEAKKEEQIIATLKQKEEEMLQKYQQNLNQKAANPEASPSAEATQSPAPSDSTAN